MLLSICHLIIDVLLANDLERAARRLQAELLGVHIGAYDCDGTGLELFNGFTHGNKSA